MDAPHNCPGTSSAQAGKADACAGCPNKDACASGDAQRAALQTEEDRAAVARNLRGVHRRVLVMSGKGGVGKSTVCAQLARALAQPRPGGLPQVAVLDVDVCGPSMAQMLGVSAEKMHVSAAGIAPVIAGDEGNIAVASISFLLDDSDAPAAVIWRGGRKHALIKRLLATVQWEDADWLLVDTPPGTSDEHLALAQLVRPITGAVLVTTPQAVAWQDVRRQLSFCRRSGIPVLGVVENMAAYACPACGADSDPIGGERADLRAFLAAQGVRLLGSVPLDPLVAASCDGGIFDAEVQPSPRVMDAYASIAQRVSDAADGLETEQSAP